MCHRKKTVERSEDDLSFTSIEKKKEKKNTKRINPKFLLTYRLLILKTKAKNKTKKTLKNKTNARTLFIYYLPVSKYLHFKN